MFSWIPFYAELASVILNYRDRQNELIDILKELKGMNLPIIRLVDQENNGEVPLGEIDPFTFFATFNQGVKETNRIEILNNLKQRFQLKAEAPSDFDGIPIVMALKAWFFPYKKERKPGDIQALWGLAEAAVQGEIDNLNKDLFNRCIKIKSVGVPKLTMGLFWLSPNKFMPFDKKSRAFFMKRGLKINVGDFDSYKSFLKQVRSSFKEDFHELSRIAEVESNKNDVKYWQIAPGENARLWPELKSNSIAAVGWNEFDLDLTKKTKDELLNIYKDKYPNTTDHERKIGATMLWNFLTLKPGDRFVTNKGQSLLLGLGIVKGGYKFRPEREEYRHTVDVDYYNVSETGITIPDKYKGKFGKTIVPLTEDTFRTLAELFPHKTFWIFQANPEYYDLEGSLKACKEFNWGIAQHKEKIKKGDEVYLWLSGPNAGIYAIAEVLTEPRPLPEEPCEKPFILQPEKLKERPAVRIFIKQVLDKPVTRAMILENPILKNLTIITAPQGTNFSLTVEEADLIRKLIWTDPILPRIPRRIQAILERKGQVILYGPPGTGKTYWAEQTAQALASHDGDLVRMCTFHPAYGYEDFLEGYRPEVEDGKLVFKLKPGIFKQLCEDAQKSERSFYLIIDEINRGDIPRIFGELLTVLEKDKRGKSVLLPLSGQPFSVPDNVFVIGTMNTADRSIALLDKALRRRFGFWELMPDSAVLKDAVVEGISLGPWLEALNQRLLENIGRDARNLQIGHAYLFYQGYPVVSIDRFARILQEDIIPLLEEYCYEDFSTLVKILGPELVDEKKQRLKHELFDPDRRDELVQALRSTIAPTKAATPSEPELTSGIANGSSGETTA